MSTRDGGKLPKIGFESSSRDEDVGQKETWQNHSIHTTINMGLPAYAIIADKHLPDWMTVIASHARSVARKMTMVVRVGRT